MRKTVSGAFGAKYVWEYVWDSCWQGGGSTPVQTSGVTLCRTAPTSAPRVKVPKHSSHPIPSPQPYRPLPPSSGLACSRRRCWGRNCTEFSPPKIIRTSRCGGECRRVAIFPILPQCVRWLDSYKGKCGDGSNPRDDLFEIVWPWSARARPTPMRVGTTEWPCVPSNSSARRQVGRSRRPARARPAVSLSAALGENGKKWDCENGYFVPFFSHSPHSGCFYIKELGRGVGG